MAATPVREASALQRMLAVAPSEAECWDIIETAIKAARWPTERLANDSVCGALASSCAWRQSSARMVQRRLRDPFKVVGLDQWLIVELCYRGHWSSSVCE